MRALLVGLFFFGVSLANASLVTVDFSGPHAGDIITNQFAGVTISLLGSAPIPGPRIYVLQDTSGNPVDVLGAKGNAITPGDNVGGINAPFFDIQFSFKKPIDYFSIRVLDAEENFSGSAFIGNHLVQTNDGGSLLGFHFGSVFNGPVRRLELGSIGSHAKFNRVVIDLTENDGPELYDSLVFNTVRDVPEASTLLMCIAPLGLLAVRRFRSM